MEPSHAADRTPGQPRRGAQRPMQKRRFLRYAALFWLAAVLAGPQSGAAGAPQASSAAAPAPPRPAKTVIVVLENRSASQVYGNPDMPFFDSMARHGAVMTHSTFGQTPYGVVPRGYASPLPARPSQPNYLYLVAGNNQGVLPEYFECDGTIKDYPYSGQATNGANGDRLDLPHAGVRTGIGNRLVPAAMRPFTTPNLGAAVIAHGGSFASFCETLPYPRFDQERYDGGAGLYVRKHNPVINWIDWADPARRTQAQGHVLPETANLGFAQTTDPRSGRHYRGFAVDEDGKPLPYDDLPTVALVVPNQQHDAHDGSLREADEWLRQNIQPYADWAMTHDALLILTFDEDGWTRAGIDTVPTVLYGPMVKPGRYAEPIDHLNVLSTVLMLHADLTAFRQEFALAYSGDEAARELANLRPIVDVFGAGPALAARP